MKSTIQVQTQSSKSTTYEAGDGRNRKGSTLRPNLSSGSLLSLDPFIGTAERDLDHADYEVTMKTGSRA
jgi:hypothetical protein